MIDVAVHGGQGVLGRRVEAALARRAGAFAGGVGGRVVLDASGAVPPEQLVVGTGRVVDVSLAASRGLRLSELAPPAGTTVVAGAGWAFALGDLLGAIAASYLLDPVEAHVTYWVPGRRSVLARSTPGERRDLRRTLATPAVSLTDGEVDEDRIGERRRLAWFPRPVGPHHAASVPGLEWRTLPQHVPGLRTVRTHVALRSWMAEVVQGLGNASRTAVVRDRVARPGRLRDASDSSERWAVVSELREPGGRVARAWAYGTGRHDLAAEVAADQVVRLALAEDPPVGLLAPSLLGDPRETLDAFAAVTDLRWGATATDG